MGSNAAFTAAIIIFGAATLAGKDPTSIKLPAPQVAEMAGNGIGKEFAPYCHFRLSYGKFTGLNYAVRFIHVLDIYCNFNAIDLLSLLSITTYCFYRNTFILFCS